MAAMAFTFVKSFFKIFGITSTNYLNNRLADRMRGLIFF